MCLEKKFKAANIEDKIIKLGCEISLIESVSRILTECHRENSNLKHYDNENLSFILFNQILKLKESYKDLSIALEI